MKNILHITTSIKGEASLSLRLSETIIDKLAESYPAHEVITHDLSQNPMPHLEGMHLAAFGTPVQERSPEHFAAAAPSDAAIAELMSADAIVIGVPLYNFGIPSTLKSWIDHVVRAGVTFTYESGVPEGLAKNKKVYLAIATGGIYSEGPMKSYDYSENYLRAVLGFIGLTDIMVFRIEGSMMSSHAATALPAALEAVTAYPF